MDQEEQLIAYCGLNCADCHGYNGRIPDLARDLRRELRSSRYEKFAQFISQYSFGRDFVGYDDCYKVLGAMVKFRCRKGCRSGGGSPFCAIRKCAQKRDLEGCWLCGDQMTSEKLDFLNPVHGDAHRKNLRLLAKVGKSGLLKRGSCWYSSSG